jgi:hypothetical protein
MNGQTILLISDMRQVYLAEILTKKGMSVRCLDIRNSQTVEEQLLKLKKFLAGAAMLVLPIPVTKVPEQERLNEILNKRSQDLEKYYRLNGAIYICKTENNIINMVCNCSRSEYCNNAYYAWDISQDA